MSITKSPTVVFLISIILSSQLVSAAFPPSLQLLRPSHSRAMARSLLDLVTNGQVSGGGSGSADTDKEKSSLLDLAQALIQGSKNNENSLYLKVFKLLLNLFMDVMMDRMAAAKRREDPMGQISWVNPVLEQPKPQFHPFQPYTVVKAQRSSSEPPFKPYFVN